jgi:uncharacterized protein YndB with AHSA1/START domain
MSKEQRASTSTSRIIKASPEALYEVFMDPAILMTWLPPGQMTGRLHAFDGRVGGGYRLSLFYPADDNSFRGKTTEKEDLSEVRFVELVPARKIVEAVTFVSDDQAFKGEMTIVVTFDKVPGGTSVTFACTDLPRGLRAEDNEAGAQESLAQLARRFEGPEAKP